MLAVDKSLILNKIKEYLSLATNKDFAKYLEIKPTALSMWYKRNTFDVETIFTKCDFLDANWLLTGQGSMLKTKSTDEIEQEPSKYAGYYYPNVDASAGLNFSTKNGELDKIPVSIPYWGENLQFINVFGDSMYPKFHSGEIIGIKEIEYIFLTYGNTYVVVLQNGDVHLKYVKKGKDEEHVILASENNFYEDREFYIKHIRTFYQVKGVISRLAM